MLKDKICIDKNDLPAKLVQWADKLTVDYWGNLFEVLEEMQLASRNVNEKLKRLYRYISIKEIQQYGKLMDEEEKFEKSDNYKK